jgi:hypothetical protein
MNEIIKIYLQKIINCKLKEREFGVDYEIISTFSTNQITLFLIDMIPILKKEDKLKIFLELMKEIMKKLSTENKESTESNYYESNELFAKTSISLNIYKIIFDYHDIFDYIHEYDNENILMNNYIMNICDAILSNFDDLRKVAINDFYDLILKIDYDKRYNYYFIDNDKRYNYYFIIKKKKISKNKRKK